MTPLHIEIALYYFKSRGSKTAAFTGRDIDAVARIHQEFLGAGLLENAGDNRHWKGTDKLRLYVEALCDVPVPATQSVHSSEDIAQYASILRDSDIGDTTVRTRNAIISTVLDKYRTVTPLAKM